VELPWSVEADVAATLGKLPPSFVTSYVGWATSQTDAPLLYHLPCVLGLLATVAPVDLILQEGPGGPVIANFFGIVVGRQGYERKSTATGLAARLLAEAMPTRLGDDPGSGEGLIASLAEQAQQLVDFSEFGDFLARTKARAGGNYQNDLKPKLMNAWDGRPMSRRLSRRSVRCDTPRLNIMAAVNPALIAKHSEYHDFAGGLYSRFNFAYAHRIRRQGRATRNVAAETMLREWLSQVAGTAPDAFGKCLGMSAAAEQLWEEFAYAIEESGLLLPDDKYVGIHARAPVHALKIALLLSFGCGIGHPTGNGKGTGWRIPLYVMEVAIDLATRFYQGAVAVFADVEGTPDMIDRRACLDAIGDDWTPLGTITRKAKILVKRAEPIIRTLVAEGFIEELHTVSVSGGETRTESAKKYRMTHGAPRTSGIQAAMDVKDAVDRALDLIRSRGGYRGGQYAQPFAALPGEVIDGDGAVVADLPVADPPVADLPVVAPSAADVGIVLPPGTFVLDFTPPAVERSSKAPADHGSGVTDLGKTFAQMDQ
jgi:hypothetical protein